MAYATEQQLSTWLGEPAPADAEQLLRIASQIVDGMLLAAVYKVDEQGKPADSNTATALQDATCAQVEYLMDTGDTSGAIAGWQNVSIGSANLSRGSSSPASAASRESPHAALLLRNAGLLPGMVIHQ